MQISVDTVKPINPADEGRVRGALIALGKGKANESQQREAVAFILDNMCGLFAASSGGMTSDARAFSEGKRFIGIKIAEYTKANLLTLPKEE